MVWSLRGTAHSFACLVLVVGSVVEALPFMDFLAWGQLDTLCPARPQKRQRSNLKWQSCSSGANLPFLSSLLVLGFLGLDENKDKDDFNCTEGCEEVKAVLSVLLLLAGFEDL